MSPFQIRDRLSPNHDQRNDPARIDTLVLHYTGMPSAGAAMDRLRDPNSKVSAHYLVEENGAIWRLVPDTRRAFHAGLSCWEGRHDLNAVSIGIEIVNPGHDWGYRPFPEAQMASVEALCGDLISRHAIPPHRIVGHSDIAPERKSDPGELFDWPRLALAGIGIWPPVNPRQLRSATDRARALADLILIGYCATQEALTSHIAAFQRRFRPDRCDGWLDPETAARLSEVRTAYLRSRAASDIRPRR